MCLESHDRYYFNILRIITLLFHLYIEYKLYEWSYEKNVGHINETRFIENTMGKCNDPNTFDEKMRKMGF